MFPISLLLSDFNKIYNLAVIFFYQVLNIIKEDLVTFSHREKNISVSFFNSLNTSSDITVTVTTWIVLLYLILTTRCPPRCGDFNQFYHFL